MKAETVTSIWELERATWDDGRGDLVSGYTLTKIAAKPGFEDVPQGVGAIVRTRWLTFTNYGGIMAEDLTTSTVLNLREVQSWLGGLE